MKDQSYSISIEVAGSPDDVFSCINDVPGWFKDKGFAGSCTELNDQFIFRYGDGAHFHYSRQRLIEVIPGRKIVWLVTNSMINWIENNKEEWTNTKIIFEIASKEDKTVLHFTHDGLVPGLECYSECKQGWNMIINDWLYNFITESTKKSIV
jgi:hypothetical protein